MGARGPRPQPANVRLLHGETRPSQVNFDEPVPVAVQPVLPRWAGARVRKVWQRVSADLAAMDLLFRADQDALLVYCEAVVKYEDACRLVDEGGLLVVGDGGRVVKNPAVQLMRDFGQSVRGMAAEFGLTPAARVGLKAGQRPVRGGAERLLS
jgi:P27 family predicted phage terminase small subunit